MLKRDPTLDNTVGALVLGMAGAAFFVGLSTLQAYIYYQRFPNDSRLHKISVAILLVLDTFHLMLVTHVVWYYAVTNYGNFAGLNRISWSLKLQMPIDTIIIIMVQSLYAFRVIQLSKYHRSILGYLTLIAVTWGLVIGIIISYKIYSATFFTEIYDFSWVINATFASSTIVDTVIAVSMVWYLSKAKGENRRLNSRIGSIIQYTLGSGALTCACSLSCMFTWMFIPDTFNFIALAFFLTKLYVGSFFAMLNARQPTSSTPSEEIRLEVSIHKFHDPVSPSSPTSPPKTYTAQDSGAKTHPW